MNPNGVKLNLRAFLIIVFGVLFTFTFIYEIIPVNNNMGWDGVTFNDIAKHGVDDIQNKSMRWYYIFRIFPFIVYDIVGFPELDLYILWFSRILNFVFITFSVVFYFRICKLLNAENMVANLIFVLLFFSFPILKFVNYYPMLTDHISFFLSLAGIYFTLSKNKFLIIFTIIFSLFTFPSLAFMLILINVIQQHNGIKLFKVTKSKNIYLIIIFKIVLISLGIYFYNLMAFGNQEPVTNSANLNESLLEISTILLVLYFMYITFSLLRTVLTNGEITFKINVLYFTLSILMFLCIWYVFNSFQPMTRTGISSLGGIAYLALTMPLNFLIYHTFYFGVIVIFLLAKMKDIFASALKLGTGFFLATLIIYFFMIQNESRMLTNLISFLAIPLLKAFENVKLSKGTIYLIFIVCIIQSRFYIKINNTSNFWKLMEDPSEYLKFPVQRYFMNFGPWVSEQMYWIQLILFLLLIGIYFLFYKMSNNLKSKKLIYDSPTF
jgi:hypothetical protein